jgi:hypothetical protein
VLDCKEEAMTHLQQGKKSVNKFVQARVMGVGQLPTNMKWKASV